MKRVFALLLVTTLLVTLNTVLAFADTSETEVASGAEVIVSGFVDKDGNSADYDFDNEYYAVAPAMTKGKTYVDKVYFKDGLVYLKVKSGIIGEYTISGKVRVTDKETREKYTADVEIYVNAGRDARMGDNGDGTFYMPSSFQSQRVKFVTNDGEQIGTFIADFIDDAGYKVARYSVKVVDQNPLFLAFTQPTPDVELFKKNDGAKIRSISWTATPKFDSTGTLGIVMEPNEYLYSVGLNGSLTLVNGTYNRDAGRFEFKTNTLGTYLISNQKLVGATASASSSSTASSVPASSSSSAASKPASSTAPSSSSSTAPVSSSSETSSSSSMASSSSEVSSAPSSTVEPSSSASSSTNAPVEKPSADGNNWIVPTIIAVVVVLIGVVLYFVLGKKKKSYDSWDE